MGWASCLENILERRPDDCRVQAIWNDFTRHSRQLRNEESVNGLRRNTRPLSHYLHCKADRIDIRDAIEERGNPFEYPRRLIKRFWDGYSRSGLEPLGSGSWAQHVAATNELHAILTAMQSNLNAELVELNLKETESALAAFFQRYPDYGPLAPAAHMSVLGQVETFIARAREVEQQLSDFRLEASMLEGQERELTEVDEAIAELKQIEHNLEQGYRECDSVEDMAKDIQVLWDEFLRLHVLASRPRRPAIKELNRLWLNEAQERIVATDYSGHLRLLGASGSGKTIILLHRALRLAAENPGSSILVVTLNRSLGSVLDDATNSLNGGVRPANVRIASLFDLFQDALALFRDRTGWKSIESIRMNWQGNIYACKKAEFFGGFGKAPHKLFTQSPAQVLSQPRMAREAQVSLFEYVRHKAGDTNEEIASYIWDECRYVQGALPRNRREEYLKMLRLGRGVPLRPEYRHILLKGLSLWEHWLDARKLFEHETVAHDLSEVLGDQSALKTFQDKLGANHLLVDESQDLSTLDLSLIRRLLKNSQAQNSLFLAGDVRQQVYGRHHHPPSAGLNFQGRSRTLSQNYRNTREILTAARRVALAYPPPISDDAEFIDPELSPFSGARPLVIESSLGQQAALVRDLIRHRADRRIGVITNNQDFLADMYTELQANGIYPLLLVANGRMDSHLPRIRSGSLHAVVTLSDLESVKGYEFDTVFMADASQGCCPWLSTPADEYWRSAAAFYAALTRARDELLIAHSGRPSVFVDKMGADVDRKCILGGGAERRVFELLRNPLKPFRTSL